MRLQRQVNLVIGFALSTVLSGWWLIGCGSTPAPTDKLPTDPNPFSTRDGRTIRIEPYGATFDLPEAWVSSPYPGKNLFLSREDLKEIGHSSAGSFIHKESAMLNAI